MTKVHPNSPSVEFQQPSSTVIDRSEEFLTVWRKSLLFNCKGFTVFDSKGNLKFRVDNYSTRSKREIILMDATGVPMFTIRRKRLSLAELWLIYEGEETTRPQFSVTKHVTFSHSKWLAHLTPCSITQSPHHYVVEGSYLQRYCTVYDDRQQVVAEVRSKEAAPGVNLGGDVFRLVVHAGFDGSFAMAIVVLLDQMFEV